MISTPELNCRVHWDFSSLGEMLRGLGLWTNSGNRSMAFSPCLCPASPQAHALLLRSSVGRIGIVCGFMGPTSEARLQASLCTVWRNFVWWLVVCCQNILPQLLKPGKENTIMVPYSGPTHFSIPKFPIPGFPDLRVGLFGDVGWRMSSSEPFAANARAEARNIKFWALVH